MSDDDPTGAAETSPREAEAASALLRHGFAALGERAVPGPDCPEPERIWAAAAGEGTPAERQEIVLHVSTCASCATAFRLARELGREEGAAARRSPLVRFVAPLAALAALLVLTVAIPRLRLAEDPPYRGGEGSPIRSLTGAGEDLPALSSASAELRWTPGPAGSRYEVRVVTAQGEEIAVEGGLEEPRFSIPAPALLGRPAGTRLHWQVTALHPDGTRETSRTFTVQLR